SGPKLVTKLDVFPLDLAENPKEIRDRLLGRGQRFGSLRGFHVMNCTGKKYIAVNGTELVKPVRLYVLLMEQSDSSIQVSGRVIVDTYAFYKCQDMVAPALVQGTEAEQPSADVDEPSDEELNDEGPNEQLNDEGPGE